MNKNYAEAGNKEYDVRADCWIKIKITNDGGLNFAIKSKVDSLYGTSIRKLLLDILSFYEIANAEITLEDSGALPYVIMARMETAIRRIGIAKGKKYLPVRQIPIKSSERDRFRRSRLYLPGDQPKLFINAALHKGDGLILDLEDSVAPTQKDAARILVRNALISMDFMDSERMVRINQLPLGMKDLEEIVPQLPHLILIPKVESPDQIQQIDEKINEILEKEKLKQEIFLMPIIESGKGILNALPIAMASKRNVALAIGLEDYTADIGVQRTSEGQESFFARSMLINAARAAGLQAIDTVFSDVSDMEGLHKSVKEAKALGFDGKGCIHPRQIAVVHKAFAPGETEIKKAKKIVLAFEQAEKKGLGVVSLGSKMIDPPVVKRALHTINLALKEGIISKDWRNENE